MTEGQAIVFFILQALQIYLLWGIFMNMRK